MNINYHEYQNLKVGDLIITKKGVRVRTLNWHSDRTVVKLGVTRVKKINKTCITLEDGGRLLEPRAPRNGDTTVSTSHTDFRYVLYTKDNWRKLRIEQLRGAKVYRALLEEQLSEGLRKFLDSYTLSYVSKKIVNKVLIQESQKYTK